MHKYGALMLGRRFWWTKSSAVVRNWFNAENDENSTWNEIHIALICLFSSGNSAYLHISEPRSTWTINSFGTNISKNRGPLKFDVLRPKVENCQKFGSFIIRSDREGPKHGSGLTLGEDLYWNLLGAKIARRLGSKHCSRLKSRPLNSCELPFTRSLYCPVSRTRSPFTFELGVLNETSKAFHLFFYNWSVHIKPVKEKGLFMFKLMHSWSTNNGCRFHVVCSLFFASNGT